MDNLSLYILIMILALSMVVLLDVSKASPVSEKYEDLDVPGKACCTSTGVPHNCGATGCKNIN